MHYGPIPRSFVIDHVDGDPTNNRLKNLRLATFQQNMRNSHVAKNNNSGFKGVSLNKKSGRYVSYVNLNNQHIHLGSFETAEEAYEARCKASKELYKDFDAPNRIRKL